jgi:hypothetical protein
LQGAATGKPARPANYVSLTYSGLRFLNLSLWLGSAALCGNGSDMTASIRLEFRDHHTNTQAPPNEQAGTCVSAQPLVTRFIDSQSKQQGNF